MKEPLYINDSLNLAFKTGGVGATLLMITPTFVHLGDITTFEIISEDAGSYTYNVSTNLERRAHLPVEGWLFPRWLESVDLGSHEEKLMTMIDDLYQHQAGEVCVYDVDASLVSRLAIVMNNGRLSAGWIRPDDMAKVAA